MNNKIIIEFDDRALQSIIKSEEIQELLREQANAIRDRAGGTFQADMHMGQTRAWASVKATSYEDRKRNAEENTLLKAMGGKL